MAIEMLGSEEAITEPKCRPFLEPSGFKLQVKLPSPVHLQHATDAAELLYAGMDQISPSCYVDRVEISEVRFTSEGASSLMMFLALQASKLKFLQIRNIYPVHGGSVSVDNQDGSSTSKDAEALSCLALAFQDARLQSLDLSKNCIHADLWQQFRGQTNLESLILDEVDMDDESITTLANEMERSIHTSSLSKLLFANQCESVSQRGVESTNNILRKCTKLKYLRLAQVSSQSTSKVMLSSSSHHETRPRFPLQGLHDVAQKMKRINGGLQHLELEGVPLSDMDISGRYGICSSLSLYGTLKKLKLKNVGLTSSRLRGVVIAIKKARLSIEMLDLSENLLGNDGAKVLATIGDSLDLQGSLRTLNIENDGIGTKGAIDLFSGLVSKGMNGVNIVVDRNPLNMSEVAFALATGKREVEVQRDSIRDEHDRVVREQHKSDPRLVEKLVEDLEGKASKLKRLTKTQASLVTDIQDLHHQVDKLAKEKETLIAAFAVLGASRAVEDRSMVLERLDLLEAAVQNGYKAPRPPSISRSKSPHPMDSLGRRSLNESSPRIHPKQRRKSEDSLTELGEKQTAQKAERQRLVDRSETPIDSSQSDLQFEGASRRTEARIHKGTHSGPAGANDEGGMASTPKLERERSSEVVSNVMLHERLRAKLAAQQNDRTSVLDDIAVLQKRKSIVRGIEVGPKLDKYDSLEPPQRQESFRWEISQTTGMSSRESKSVTTDIAGKAEVTLPDQSGHSVDSLQEKPTLDRKNRSFKNQIATGDRFERLLHHQIKNQMSLERSLSQIQRNASMLNLESSTSSHTSRRAASSENSAHSMHARSTIGIFSESPVHSAHARSTTMGTGRPGEKSNIIRYNESPVHSAHVRSTSLSVFLEEENRQLRDSKDSRNASNDEATGASSSGLQSTKEEVYDDEDSSIADDDMDEFTQIVVAEHPGKSKSKRTTKGVLGGGILRKTTSLRVVSSTKSRPPIPRTRSSDNGDNLDDQDVGKMRRLFEAYRDRMTRGSTGENSNSSTQIHHV